MSDAIRKVLETAATALDGIGEIEGEIDRQTYEQHRQGNFDLPDDAEITIDITAKQDRDWTNRFRQADQALSAARAALVEPEWRPMKSAPLEQPIEVKMPLYETGGNKIVGTWVATAVRHRDNDEPHWTDGVSILHYNGDDLVVGFKGPLTGWRPLPSPPTEDED